MIDATIFFVDPLTPMPHDVDVKALTWLAIVRDISDGAGPRHWTDLQDKENG